MGMNWTPEQLALLAEAGAKGASAARQVYLDRAAAIPGLTDEERERVADAMYRADQQRRGSLGGRPKGSKQQPQTSPATTNPTQTPTETL